MKEYLIIIIPYNNAMVNAMHEKYGDNMQDGVLDSIRTYILYRVGNCQEKKRTEVIKLLMCLTFNLFFSRKNNEYGIE